IAIVPNKPQASELIKRVSSADEDEMMPPPKASAKPLTAAQVETLRRWIANGAEYKQHWAYVKPVRPVLPAVKDAAWCANAIDRFILARLEAEGLTPSPAVERYALIGRVSVDLTGLPPTIAEGDAFAPDPSA